MDDDSVEQNMSEELLAVTVDKFIFKVPAGCLFSDAGVWVKVEGPHARLGLSDYAQQSNGDIAFAKVKPVGTKLGRGDEFAEIETVKVNMTFPSPVGGTIVEVNRSLMDAPELINQEPYGKGWLAVVELAEAEGALAHLLDAQAYLALVKEQAEAEMKK
jgi:glycine cleavage system H protein